MKQKIIDNNIIKNQLLPNKVNKESILKLFKQVNRNMFVDEDDANIANIDENFYDKWKPLCKRLWRCVWIK